MQLCDQYKSDIQKATFMMQQFCFVMQKTYIYMCKKVCVDYL